MTIAYEDFEKIELRCGTVVKAEPFDRFTSEFLLVGFSDTSGAICLATTDPIPPNGQKLH